MYPTSIKTVAKILPLLGAGLAALSHISYRRSMEEAEAAWQGIASRSEGPGDLFTPEMVADLPPVAQRYFRRAIAPGTPLRTTVEVDMGGEFLLGDKHRYRTCSMQACEILRPPREFVWIPRLASGYLHIRGSDVLAADTAWTRFWLLGVLPVANAPPSPDLLRSAVFRAAIESLWVPASLLPWNDVQWEASGSDTARIRFKGVRPEIVFEMRLADDGAVREVHGLRWSNANPQGVFRLQPFGGTITSDRAFGGYTIPRSLRMGNHFGTDDFLPFFQAEVTEARYL